MASFPQVLPALLSLSLLAAPAAAQEVPAGLDYPAMVRVAQDDPAVGEALTATAVEAFAAPASSVGAESSAIDPPSGYEAQPEVKTEVDESLAAAAAPPAAEQEQIQRLIEDDRLLRRFERRLAGFGYSITNLPDVMATYYVSLWEVVNAADASQQPSGVVAVRQQMGGAYGNSDTLRRLPDADKERVARSLAVTAALAETAEEQLAAQGDETELARLRDSLHEAVLQQGIDLRRLKLTSEGFTSY